MKKPRYPIYVPSKGRFERCHTAKFMLKQGVPFRLVVEPQEFDEYAERYGEDNVLCLPFSNRGSVIPARNWIKQHSIEEGNERHWQFDDNITRVLRLHKGLRIPCDANVAIRACEDFTDRYENIAIAGMDYRFFVAFIKKPFVLNVRVYSCSLVNNAIPHEWRGTYNEDTDICLQALADGWCTVLFKVFLIEKLATMTVKGGNTSEIYQGDGRLKMARSLERLWPGVVQTKRRFGRPQHAVRNYWKNFDTPLKLKDGVSLDDFERVDEYGLELTEVAPVKSPRVKKMLQASRKK